MAPFALRVHHPPRSPIRQKRHRPWRAPPYHVRVLRVAIVNDFEVVVRGLAEMLAPYADRVSVVELDSSVPVEEPVEIALLDTFAQAGGEAPQVAELLANPLVTRVVVYSWNADNTFADLGEGRGVAAYLSKTLTGPELVAALEAIQRGEAPERVVGPGGPVGAVPETPAGSTGDWPGRLEGLTAREAEVVALITRGLSNAEIAAKASLSINSVKTYIRSSYRKMGVSSRTNAVLWGLEHGFTTDRVRLVPAPAADAAPA